MIPDIKIVIHEPYGGFSLTDVIVDKLRGMKSELAAGFTSEYKMSHGWLHPQEYESDGIGLRTHRDLVKVVEDLTAEVEVIDDFKKRRQKEKEMLNGLAVKTISLSIEIECCDGAETVKVYGCCS